MSCTVQLLLTSSENGSVDLRHIQKRCWPVKKTIQKTSLNKEEALSVRLTERKKPSYILKGFLKIRL